jgi:hypothetical protein
LTPTISTQMKSNRQSGRSQQWRPGKRALSAGQD